MAEGMDTESQVLESSPSKNQGTTNGDSSSTRQQSDDKKEGRRNPSRYYPPRYDRGYGRYYPHYQYYKQRGEPTTSDWWYEERYHQGQRRRRRNGEKRKQQQGDDNEISKSGHIVSETKSGDRLGGEDRTQRGDVNDDRTEREDGGKGDQTQKEYKTGRKERTRREERTKREERSRRGERTEREGMGKGDRTQEEHKTGRRERTRREERTRKDERTEGEGRTEGEERTEREDTGKGDRIQREGRTEREERTEQRERTRRGERTGKRGNKTRSGRDNIYQLTHDTIHDENHQLKEEEVTRHKEEESEGHQSVVEKKKRGGWRQERGRGKYAYKVLYKREEEDTSHDIKNPLPMDTTTIDACNIQASTITHRHENKKRKPPAAILSSTQSDELSQQLMGGFYECSVCCDSIKHHQEVWSCRVCYHIFHLRCIRRWAHSFTAAADEEHPEDGWRCPCCRNVSTIIPSAYTCFCGGVLNPNKSRRRGDLSVPHSCGEPCRKRLGDSVEGSSCQHKCPQLCHPGPCPPCPVMVTRKCPCGQKSSYVRCSQYDALPSCGQVCGRPLNCGLHYCTQVCHEGACPNCEVTVEKRCFCMKECRSLLCGQLISFSCKKMCNKPLSCGNHTCESLCHDGDCSLCPLQPESVSHCPCGATPIRQLLPVGVVRTSCLDDVPLCDNKCSKPLPCSLYSNDSLHYCSKSCHHGPCPPCTLTSVVYCKCGKTHQKVPCSQANQMNGFTCNRNCGKKLSCGHHRCQTKCCTSDTHTCERVCDRKHDCGRHSCRDTCHPGRCGPCWNISYEELSCHCGNEIMLPPIQCGTAPPTCNRPCARVHSCNHPVTHTCHSEETCPPCTFLTDKMCMGNHVIRHYIPCHLKDVSCGKHCGRPLSCGMHKCRKICHKGSCENDSELCTQPCTNERKYCPHLCGEPCHIGKECPDRPCKAKVIIKCGCGRRKEEVVCLAEGSSVTSQTFHKLYSGDLSSLMRDIQSGQSVKIDSVTMKTAHERYLECDEECAQMERNKKLAEALELTNVDHSPHTPPQYTSFLLEQGKIDLSLVTHVEQVFKKLIISMKEKGTTTSHNFKPMKHTQRRLVHELAEVYGLNSISYDAEPNRNVVVMATKKSILPSQTLSQTVSQVKPMPAPLPIKKSSPVHQSKPDQEQEGKQPDYFNDD